MPISEQLCAWVYKNQHGHIPQNVLHTARLSLLDWSAVSIAGVKEPVSQAVQALLNDEAGAAQASVIGQTKKFPMRAAAMANGATSHALDYDDTHFAHIGHPSVAIVPAALAVAEKHNARLKDTLHATVLGIEASIHIGLWLGRTHYQHGFHQTATAGAFGATLAAGKLAKLNEAQLGFAMGITSTRASGLKAQFGTMGKPFNAGIAASNGVEAMLLAQHGMESQASGFECEKGFSETHASDALTQTEALAFLGEQYYLTSMQYKFHACCHGTHASIEACKVLQNENECKATDIKAVKIEVHPRWLSVCDIKKPATGLEAKFSLAFCAAMTFGGYETASIDRFNDELCNDAALNALQERVIVESDEQLSEMQAQVSVECTDGRTLHAHYDLAQEIGLEALQAKVMAKASALIGEDAASEVWGLISQPEARACEFGELLASLSVR